MNVKKPVDLNSLVSSYENLSEKTFKEIKKFLNFEIKNEEVEQISTFINNLTIDNSYLGYFYVGYTIPQINKEFDLLRFGENYILNIEIKSILNEEKAKKQLEKNEYYLSSLEKKLKLFTYISSDNTFYHLKDDGAFQPVSFDVFEKLLLSQKLEHHSNIDNVFDPTEYLISPFNDTRKFINEEYFLTQQQQEFKNRILSGESQIVSLLGLPGTGKTLLLYDLAKTLQKKYEVMIIHTGQLNEGHLKLTQEYKWDIISIKNINEMKDLEEHHPDIIFLDETQRMRPKQLSLIVKNIQENSRMGIFSIDPKQILSVHEHQYKNLDSLNSLEEHTSLLLSKKIRTNKELADFIKGLFDLNKMHYVKDTKNISVHYFDDITQARGFSEGMESEGWQIIDYTAQNFNGEAIKKMKLNKGPNTHGVLGQEFDKVLVLVGSTFYYNEQNSLASKATYYDPERMLYQSVTRARKQIMLLIVDNPEFMSKLMGSFNYRR